MWRAIRDQSGSDLSTHGPQGKQNNVSTSPNTLGVHLPLLQAPSGVLSSPQPSVSVAPLGCGGFCIFCVLGSVSDAQHPAEQEGLSLL